MKIDQIIAEGTDERKQNALWAQITAHEKAAKKSKDLKQQHHLKMADQLRSQLKTSDLNEFAPGSGDDREPDEEEILRQLASRWWLGTEQQMAQAQKTLDAMGWEIGPVESGDDDAGVFLIRPGDENGDTYISFDHSELSLDESVAEAGEWTKLPNGNYRNMHTGVVSSKPPVKKKRGEKTGAEWDAIEKAKKDKEQGVAEMDSQGYTGSRDRKRTSKYGSRDHYDLGGPESTGRPLTAKQMMDKAHKAMLKSMSNDEKVDKGWRNPNIDEGSSNIGNAIKDLYQKIYNAGDDEIEYFYNDSPIFAQYWDEYEGDLDSIIAEVDPGELQVMLDELESYVQNANLAEGWREEAEDTSEWAEYVRTKLMNTPNQQRYSVAQRLSQIEVKNFGSNLVTGHNFDPKTGKPTGGRETGMTKIVYDTFKALKKPEGMSQAGYTPLQREPEEIDKPDSRGGRDLVIKTNMGWLSIPDAGQAPRRVQRLLYKAFTWGPEIYPFALEVFQETGDFTEQDLQDCRVRAMEIRRGERLEEGVVSYNQTLQAVSTETEQQLEQALRELVEAVATTAQPAAPQTDVAARKAAAPYGYNTQTGQPNPAPAAAPATPAAPTTPAAQPAAPAQPATPAAPAQPAQAQPAADPVKQKADELEKKLLGKLGARAGAAPGADMGQVTDAFQQKILDRISQVVGVPAGSNIDQVQTAQQAYLDKNDPTTAAQYKQQIAQAAANTDPQDALIAKMKVMADTHMAGKAQSNAAELATQKQANAAELGQVQASAAALKQGTAPATAPGGTAPATPAVDQAAIEQKAIDDIAVKQGLPTGLSQEEFFKAYQEKLNKEQAAQMPAAPAAPAPVAETKQKSKTDHGEADYGDDYQAMVKRLKHLAGAGPLKTVYDPAKRVYKNVPQAVQPKK